MAHREPKELNMKTLNATFDLVTHLDRDGKHGVEYWATKKNGQDVVIKTIIEGCLRTPKTIDAMPTKFIADELKKVEEIYFIDYRDPLVPFITFSIYKTGNKFHSFIMEYETEKYHSLTIIENLPRAIMTIEHHLEDYGYYQEGELILTRLKDML